MSFANKIVIVTGASGGIGRSIAVQFAQQGACVAVHYHREEAKARETLRLLSGEGHLPVQAKVMEPDAAHTLVGRSEERRVGKEC